MSFHFRSIVAVAVTAVVVCVAAEASAQDQGGIAEPRAPQGLFGAVRQESATKKLDLTLSLAEGYDSDVPPGLLQVVDPSDPTTGGFSTIFNGAANYTWAGRRVSFDGNAITNWRHYSKIGETRGVGHSAGLGVTTRFGPRTEFIVNGAFAYSPTYLYDLFPIGDVVVAGSAPTTVPDYSVADFDAFAYSAHLGFRRQISTRARLTADAEYSITDRQEGAPGLTDTNSQIARVDYSHNVKRNTALVAAYRYRKGEFNNAVPFKTTENGVDFGVVYTKPFSATRRASFDFRLGVSGANVPISTTSEFFESQQYLAIGEFGLTYDFARTWQTRFNFKRGLEYVLDLPQPVFADGISASVAGLLSRRVDVFAMVGYASGESLVNRSNLLFDTYLSDVRLRFGVTRTLAMYVEYLHYYYEFTGTAILAPGLPPGLDRNGIRVGLSLWVPAGRW